MIYTSSATPFWTYVASDVTTTNTGTNVVDITGLYFPVIANGLYGVQGILKTNVNSGTAGMKFQWTGPASATNVLIQVAGTTTSITGVPTIGTITALNALGGTAFNAVAADGYYQIQYGIINNGANAGTVQLQFVKVTSQTAKIYAGSWLMAVLLT